MNTFSERLAELSGKADLSTLIAKRDALNHQIKLIEDGIKKAAYDACMAEQHLRHNERRLAEGKRQLSTGEFAAGIFDEDQPHDQ